MGLGTIRQWGRRAARIPAEPGDRLYQGLQRQLLRGKDHSALSRGHGTCRHVPLQAARGLECGVGLQMLPWYRWEHQGSAEETSDPLSHSSTSFMWSKQ